jgi:hypothetical protein
MQVRAGTQRFERGHAGSLAAGCADGLAQPKMHASYELVRTYACTRARHGTRARAGRRARACDRTVRAYEEKYLVFENKRLKVFKNVLVHVIDCATGGQADLEKWCNSNELAQ